MAGNSILLAAVSLLSACQQSYFAFQVGRARLKYKIMPPAVSGSPEFDRIFRAQQNSVEFYPAFMITLWMAGWYFNQVFATCLGLVYIYARHQYFWGYSEAANKRIQTDEPQATEAECVHLTAAPPGQPLKTFYGSSVILGNARL
uniref:Microsomal glutathione S-transferase 2 n=1 Tax=Equus asinus TaxID=9793 RepID=A0A9L0I6C1_EQUAS